MEEVVRRSHSILEDLGARLAAGTPFAGTTAERMLRGPLSDAMTHAGQLAMLRRLAGSPLPPEDFIMADIDPSKPGPDQPDPASPDAEWPEAP